MEGIPASERTREHLKALCVRSLTKKPAVSRKVMRKIYA
jgi:hypothetical protein